MKISFITKTVLPDRQEWKSIVLSTITAFKVIYEVISWSAILKADLRSTKIKIEQVQEFAGSCKSSVTL